jgi:predicted choloylglycine hydrolase
MTLASITRTEVYFTSHLYHISKNNKSQMEAFLRCELNLSQTVVIVDSSFEFCFFRDMGTAERMKREKDRSFLKQTFDNIYVLSDDSIVIIEAKAHQKFNPEQIETLYKAKEKIIKHSNYKSVYLIGLHSSKYSPKKQTIEGVNGNRGFDATITWKDLAKCFDDAIFTRADQIYNDGKRKGNSDSNGMSGE